MVYRNPVSKKIKKIFTKVVTTLSLLLISGQNIASDHVIVEPEFIGTMSCGTSTCHGARIESSTSNILRNEFNTWYEKDPHSRSYEALNSALGKQIERNLGLEDATSNAMCIHCHITPTTNYKASKDFNPSEGVSCEGCHGPASLWLKPHAKPRKKTTLVELGMYPTEIPQRRAELCLSCHLGGTDKQIVTHQIMAAGHPRLVFELATFTEIQPAHYASDKDYRSRKPDTEEIRVWATGQMFAARQFLRLVQKHALIEKAIFPEFSFYECHTCHHSVETIRWQARKSNPLGPGQLRLNDSSILMSISLLKIVDLPTSEKLETLIKKLHVSSTKNSNELEETIMQIDASLAEANEVIRNFKFNPNHVVNILKELTAAGRVGEYSDFSSAEQAVMAVAVLVDALKRTGNSALLPKKIDDKLNDFYTMLENEDSFRPRRLQNIMKKITGSIE